MQSIAPQVSVVIPAYNQAHFLAYAINSALAQTFRDFEIIVVDDGSTDNTAAIAKEFGDSICHIYQANQGLSAARNTAIRNAKGNIIALLDSDDLWEPNFLEVMTNLLSQYPEAAGIYCGFQYIDSDGCMVGKPSLKVVPPEKFYETMSIEGNWLAPCGVIFRRQLAEEVGLFDESMRALEDADMWIRLSARWVFIGLPQALVRYRRHHNNMSKDPERMVTAARQLREKVFGPPSGDVHTWSESKTMAYRRFFLAAAAKYLAAGKIQISADYIRRLSGISLNNAWSLPTWRALVRAHLPHEHQFEPLVQLDWQLAQTQVMALLDELSRQTPDFRDLRNRSSRIRGSAFLALAEEAGQVRELARAYGWLWRATQAYPRLVFERSYLGAFIRINLARIRQRSK
ncbi:MAG: glycosyltransferase [Chloroflexota bacterium]